DHLKSPKSSPDSLLPGPESGNSNCRCQVLLIVADHKKLKSENEDLKKAASVILTAFRFA
ncbi:MAG: hypothetical protein QGI15_05300, partial [Candidatus Scalindua sp.]|nr:hypothetical protein [Candidatus Scalindua sp.]